MATQLDPNVKDDLKTQFITREGTYRLLTLSEYSRPNRVGYTSNQSSPQVRVSIVTLPNPVNGSGNGSGNNSSGNNSASSNLIDNQQQQQTLKTQQQQYQQQLNNSNTLNGIADCNSRLNGQTTTTTTTTNTAGTLGGATTLINSQYGVPATTIEARLGGGISMHSMMNGIGNGTEQNGLAGQIYGGDRICYNFGRELYVYAFRGVKKGSDMGKPLDKKFYKGTNPSCHDFNVASATPTGAPLLVGFTTGQIQLVSPHPGPREIRKLYNEERLIDKTKVTCLKWLPNSTNLFLASHASGHLYLYNEDLPCIATAPNYQAFKLGEGYTIHTCKSKSTRNPLYKWSFSTENCCINEFCFSPCGSNLAIVSQDGFLRVFHYDTMELLGIARSYFGGFLCVCWSPDGKYIVVGGEDDLVTVWSFHERRVVARGQGHRSWVSVVAFDPYSTSYTAWDGGEFSDDEIQMNEYHGTRDSRFSGDSSAGNGFDFPCGEKVSTPVHAARHQQHSASFRSDTSSSTQFNGDKLTISYRLGSVSQDTQICLWDITEDVLRHPLTLRQRVNSCNVSDTSYMNGGVDADGVKVIRPIAISNTKRTGSFTTTTTATAIGTGSGGAETATSPLRENAGQIEQHSNSSSSKFSTANCTISSQSSNANTPPDEATASKTHAATTNAISSKSQNTSGGGGGGTLKLTNCISATKTQDSPSEGGKSSSGSSSGYNSKTTTNSTSSKHSSTETNSSGGISTFNSLTQRLSNFSFLGSSNSNNSDKKTAMMSGNSFDASGSYGAMTTTSTQHRNHRKAMSLLKSYNHHNNNATGNNTHTSGQAINLNCNSTGHTFPGLKQKSLSSGHHHAPTVSNGLVTTYDPMKLIGTPACPRFDECPLLEPLVCKKIAHERLTALIFREDCFLTACQDGVVYTWARPGFSANMAQHLSPSQTAPPGGTVI